MKTPNITEAQKASAAAAASLVLAILASPGSDLVKCFALAVTGAVACVVVIADMGIRRGRASIVEASQYVATSSDEDE